MPSNTPKDEIGELTKARLEVWEAVHGSDSLKSRGRLHDLIKKIRSDERNHRLPKLLHFRANLPVTPIQYRKDLDKIINEMSK